MSLFDSASICITPNGVKEGKLYSIKPTDGSGDLSVTRATTATRVNSAGLVEVVPYNLLTYSEQFDNANWGKSLSTVETNSIISPDGTQTATKLNILVASAYVGLYQLGNSVSNKYTMSIFVKKGTKNWFYFVNLSGINITASFNISNGTLGTVVNGTASITDFGNGWYRCTYSDANNINNSYFQFGFSDADNSYTPTSVGNGYIWGAQLVEGTSAKDYLRTETRLNIPRLDYTNGTCPSILVEPQRTNVLTYSEQFDNAIWGKEDITISSNSTISPSGITNADKSIPTTANSIHRIQVPFNRTSGVTYTISIYAKASGYNFLFINANTMFNAKATFNLSNGTVTDSTSTASITDAGNGWYKCTLTGTASDSGLTVLYLQTNSTISSATDDTFSGNGTSGIFLWGAQLESGSYATSYIPTTSASVTRNADVISKTGISSLIGQTEGTLFVDVDLTHSNTSGSVQYLMQIYKDTGNRIILFRNSFGNLSFYFLQTGIVFNSESVINSNSRHKIAFAYKSGDSAFYIDGTQIVLNTDTFSSFSSLNELHLAMNYDGGTQQEIGDYSYNSSILFKTRLSNTELAQLTTI